MQMDCQSASRQIAQDFGSTGHASAGPIVSICLLPWFLFIIITVS